MLALPLLSLAACILLTEADLQRQLDAASTGGNDTEEIDSAAANIAGDTATDSGSAECDADGDGIDGAACDGEDCDDSDATIHPGAPDFDCDGKDQDCDGLPDGALAVPAAQPTIQAAIDASVDGDTVCVVAGTYAEAVDFRDRSITLRGAGSASTTIDGGGYRTVTMNNPAGTVSLEGFTLTGGESSFGAGLYVDSAGATLADLVIEGNTCTTASSCLGTGLHLVGPADLADVAVRDNYAAPNSSAEAYVYGAGAYVYESTGTWERVTVSGNVADVSAAVSYGYVLGGGLSAAGNDIAFVDIAISDNIGTRTGSTLYQASGWGAGIFLDGDTSTFDGVTVTGNRIDFPDAADLGGASALYFAHATTELNHALVAANEAKAGTVFGGAIYVWEGTKVQFTNAVIAGNRTAALDAAWGTIRIESVGSLQFTNADIVGNVVQGASYAYGGAVYCEGTGAIKLVNTNIASNGLIAAVELYGGAIFAAPDTSTADFAYSNVFGNSEPEFTGTGSSVGYQGNISADPAYTWVSGDDPKNWDLALQAGSSAIDAGDPAAAYNDLDGTRNDMGSLGGPAGVW